MESHLSKRPTAIDGLVGVRRKCELGYLKKSIIGQCLNSQIEMLVPRLKSGLTAELVPQICAAFPVWIAVHLFTTFFEGKRSEQLPESGAKRASNRHMRHGLNYSGVIVQDLLRPLPNTGLGICVPRRGNKHRNVQLSGQRHCRKIGRVVSDGSRHNPNRSASSNSSAYCCAFTNKTQRSARLHRQAQRYFTSAYMNSRSAGSALARMRSRPGVRIAPRMRKAGLSPRAYWSCIR